MGAITRAGVLMALAAVPVPGWTGNRAMMERNAQELVDINREVLDALKAGSQDGEYRLTARIVEENGRRVIKLDRFERLGGTGGGLGATPGSIPAAGTGSASASGTGPASGSASVPDGASSPTPPSPPKTIAQGEEGAPAVPNVLAPYGQQGSSVRFGPIPNSGPPPRAPVATIGVGTQPEDLAIPTPGGGTQLLDPSKPSTDDERRQLEVLVNHHPHLKVIHLSSEEVKRLAPQQSIPPAGGAVLLLW
jgi:hypothetical protein